MKKAFFTALIGISEPKEPRRLLAVSVKDVVLFSVRLWRRACGFIKRLGPAFSADDEVKMWRRIEFRNEHQEARSPRIIQLERWL